MRSPLRFRLGTAVLVACMAGLAHGGESVVVTAEGRQPQACVDPSGRVHVAYGLGNEIRYVASDDGGKTFRNPVVVARLEKLALGMRRGPRIAATSKEVVILGISMSGEIDKGKYKVYEAGTLSSWRSTDGGRTWTGPTTVNAVRGSAAEGLHALAAGPDGTFFAAWNDNRTREMEVRGARSTDGGKTWTDETLVYRSPSKGICPCCHPSAAIAGDGTVFVMWRNHLNGYRDMHLAASADGGRRFGLAEKLGEGTWSFNACPMDGGAVVARSKDEVETVWTRDGRIFVAEPGKPERSLGRGVQAWGAAGPSGAVFAWLEKRPGRLVVLKPGGKRPEPLAEAANDPMLASGPNGKGPVVAVWEEAESASAPSGGGHAHAAKAGAIRLSVLFDAR